MDRPASAWCPQADAIINRDYVVVNEHFMTVQIGIETVDDGPRGAFLIRSIRQTTYVLWFPDTTGKIRRDTKIGSWNSQRYQRKHFEITSSSWRRSRERFLKEVLEEGNRAGHCRDVGISGAGYRTESKLIEKTKN